MLHQPFHIHTDREITPFSSPTLFPPVSEASPSLPVLHFPMPILHSDSHTLLGIGSTAARSAPWGRFRCRHLCPSLLLPLAVCIHLLSSPFPASPQGLLSFPSTNNVLSLPLHCSTQHRTCCAKRSLITKPSPTKWRLALILSLSFLSLRLLLLYKIVVMPGCLTSKEVNPDTSAGKRYHRTSPTESPVTLPLAQDPPSRHYPCWHRAASSAPPGTGPPDHSPWKG